jgi:hypothetical protein
MPISVRFLPEEQGVAMDSGGTQYEQRVFGVALLLCSRNERLEFGGDRLPSRGIRDSGRSLLLPNR